MMEKYIFSKLENEFIFWKKKYICFVDVETDPPVLGDVKVASALGLTSIYTGTMVKIPYFLV